MTVPKHQNITEIFSKTRRFISLTRGLVKFLQMYTINLSIIYQNEIQFVVIKLIYQGEGKLGTSIDI